MSRDWYPLIAVTMSAPGHIPIDRKSEVEDAIRKLFRELPGSEAKLFDYRMDRCKVGLDDDEDAQGQPETYCLVSLECEVSISDAPSEGHATDAVIDWIYQTLGKTSTANTEYDSTAEERAKNNGKEIAGVTFKVINIENDG